MSALRGLSVGSARLSGVLRGPLLVNTRQISKKKLEEGGLIKDGKAWGLPGIPHDNSANVAIPGESEEPNQVISALSWLGETNEDPNRRIYEEGEWTPESKRCGAIGRKLGLMNTYDARGAKTLCTVVQIDECQVLKVKRYLSGRGNQMINLQLGAIPANPKRLKKADLVNFRKLGVDPKRRLAEFNVTADAVLPVGSYIDVRHFVPGQYLDVRGTSKAKGFQGGMKRWGMKGQPASHGVSKAHRSIGSTGGCQDPGKVWPGKKMPGHMGDNKCTFKNMQIYKVDVERNLVFIKGHIMGGTDSTVTLHDAQYKFWNPDFPPPFPTFKPTAEDEGVSEMVMDVSHMEPIFV